MNHKVPISSSVFERLELSVQKNLSVARTVWAICSSQPFERLELSVQKKLSVFGTVRAVPFKKIRQPFQLSVGKNKTVTSSFHWKVKCREWSRFRWRCFYVIWEGWVNWGRHNCSLMRKPFIALSIQGCWSRPHHITINLWQEDILYHAVYWNAALLNCKGQ